MTEQENNQPEADSTAEALSALLDGELDELALKRLLVDISRGDAQSKAQLARWQRYQLSSAALRGEASAAELAAPNFSSLVSSAVADEAMPVGNRARLSPWQRVALAASVALASVIAVQQLPTSDRANTPLLADAADRYGEIDGQNPLSTEQAPIPDQQALAAAQQQLNDYLLQHVSQVAQQGGQGVVPFARLASFADTVSAEKGGDGAR